jgi:hypothetical protein
VGAVADHTRKEIQERKKDLVNIGYTKRTPHKSNKKPLFTSFTPILSELETIEKVEKNQWKGKTD